MTVIVVATPSGSVILNSQSVSKAITVTQGVSAWESDGVDHIKPKGIRTVDAPYLELGGKVDKITGKGLSTEDFTTAEKTKLTDLPLASSLTSSLGDKVDKVVGKELSDNNYTDAEALKLSTLVNYDDTAVVTSLAGKEVYHGVETIGTYVFSNANKTLTVPSIKYWYQGVAYTTSTPMVCDLDLTTDRDNSTATVTPNTLYFFYYKDATGKLYWSTNAWNLKTAVPVVTVFWNGSTGAVCRETHSHTRDLDWHTYNHLTIGTRWQSGMALTFTAGTAGSANPTWSVSGGTVWDEDLQFENLSAITQAIGARVFFQNSATTFSFSDTSAPFKFSGANAQYVRSSDYSLQSLTNAQFMNVWVYATGDIDRPIYFIQEAIASPYTTLATVRAVAPPSLSVLGLQPELKLLYRLVVKGDTTLVAGIASDDYRSVSSLPSGNPTTQSAASVTFSPTGNIIATSVQGAIEELDSEKVIANGAITGATKTKITYDAKGLVTSGADATTADIADSTDKRYMTDAQKTALHAAVSITDTTSINLSLTGQALSADAIMGTTAGTICDGADSRLSDPRTPTAHNQAESTISFTNITTGNATTGQHGYLPTLGGGTTNFLRADGTWQPAGGAGVSDGDKGDIVVSGSGTVWTYDGLLLSNADKPPASPNAKDDEFNDSTIDAKWSWANQGTATAVEGEILGKIRMTPIGTAFCSALTQTVPAGSWTITAKIHSGTSFIATNYAGIGVLPAVDGVFDTLMLGHATDAINTVISFRGETWTNYSTFATDRGAKTAFGNVGYLRITWNGTQLLYYVSADGVAWIDYIAAFTPSYTPGRFGIFVRGTTIKSYFDWFRVS